MSARDLPLAAGIAASIDFDARLATFDGGDGTLVGLSAEIWTIIEPEALKIVEAYWGHWT